MAYGLTNGFLELEATPVEDAFGSCLPDERPFFAQGLVTILVMLEAVTEDTLLYDDGVFFK